MREAIEEGRLIVLERVKELLIPGRYRAASFFDIGFKNEAWQPRTKIDKISNTPIEIVIGDIQPYSISCQISTHFTKNG